jgi:hypothetical protein
VATEQDAARERVLAARAELDEDLGVLEASARSAVDIPAKVRRSPAKAAAIAGGAAFLVLRGPTRIYRAVRTAITGQPAPMPKRMLPKEIEKTLRSLGDNGDKVRGALERDFADYAKKAEKDRRGLLSVIVLAAVRPLVMRGARAVGESILSPSGERQGARLRQALTTAAERAAAARASAEASGSGARERVERAGDAARARVERARRAGDRGEGDDPEMTGI